MSIGIIELAIIVGLAVVVVAVVVAIVRGGKR
jgi:hypothetical protein